MHGCVFFCTKIKQVDIDNMEDLNELEARLYAQIHHEPTNVEDSADVIEDGIEHVSGIIVNDNSDIPPNSEHSSHTNRNFSKRYWTGTGNDGALKPQQHTQHMPNLLTRDVFKRPNQEKQRKPNHQSKDTENFKNKILNPFKRNKINPTTQNNNEINAGMYGNMLKINIKCTLLNDGEMNIDSFISNKLNLILRGDNLCS